MTDLTLFPLGGLGETGALNCMLYATADSAILVDCGIAFPNEYYPGVHLISPNFDALETYRDQLKAVVLTHGHEDHIGSLPFLIKKFPELPIFATPFTYGLCLNKLKEHGLSTDHLQSYESGKNFFIDNFKIHPIFLNHSIPDTAGLDISIDGFRFLHLTDFKIDHGSIHGVTDLEHLKKIGDEGLDLLLMDSTNAVRSGWTQSEKEVRENLIEVFKGIKGRALACLFSSNSYRLQSLIDCARHFGRKIAITGRSAKQYMALARSLGILDAEGVEFYDVEEISQFADSEILVIVTGSQGEGRSVLARMSKDTFRPFSLRSEDTLIMSSKMIPGNESKVIDMLNRISLKGIEIIDETGHDAIHASGHAKEDELREIFKLTRPKSFVPIHGEHRYLKRHAEIAVEEGVDSEKSTVILNGDRLQFSNGGTSFQEPIEIHRNYWHESFHEMEEEAIVRRRKLSWNGLVTVAFVCGSQSNKLVSSVDVQSQGIFGGEREREIAESLKDWFLELIEKEDRRPFEELEGFGRSVVRQFYQERFGFKPEVIILVNEV